MLQAFLLGFLCGHSMTLLHPQCLAMCPLLTDALRKYKVKDKFQPPRSALIVVTLPACVFGGIDYLFFDVDT